MTTPKITVIGSINMDLVTRSPRFPQVGETLLGSGFQRFMGGKGANQAVAAARLGAEVQMIGAIGEDDFGRELLANLQHEGVNTEAVKVLPALPSGIANITVAEGDNHIIVVSGANFGITPADIEAEEARIAAADIVLCQLEIPMDCVLAAARLAKTRPPFCAQPRPRASTSRRIALIGERAHAQRLRAGTQLGLADRHPGGNANPPIRLPSGDDLGQRRRTL